MHVRVLDNFPNLNNKCSFWGSIAWWRNLGIWWTGGRDPLDFSSMLICTSCCIVYLSVDMACCVSKKWVRHLFPLNNSCCMVYKFVSLVVSRVFKLAKKEKRKEKQKKKTFCIQAWDANILREGHQSTFFIRKKIQGFWSYLEQL